MLDPTVHDYPGPFIPYEAALQFGDPIQLTAGSNKIGVLDITERRIIMPSFLEMMGLTRVCNIFLLLSTTI
jgi:hypothetical protein